MLKNAQEAIDLFESGLHCAEGDCVGHVRQRKVLTIWESEFPPGSVLSQSEDDYAASQRWGSMYWPRIRPHRTLDLYPAIYRIHMELADFQDGTPHRGKSYHCLMKLPRLRSLRWRLEFLKSRKPYKFCRRRRASSFIQATGVQIAHHCTHCLHEDSTPFIECVRTAPDQQSWLNGACANCGTRGNLGCDFHEYHRERPGQCNILSNMLITRFAFVLTITPVAGPAHGPCLTRREPQREDNNTFATSEHDDSNIDDSGSDSDSDSDSDDDDDDDETEEDDIDGFVNAVGKPLFPSFPSHLPVREFSYHQNQAAAGPATSSSSPAYRSLSVFSKSSPVQPERRGKLPSVTKIKELLAQSAVEPGVLPAKSASTKSLGVSGTKKDRRATHDGNALAIDNREARHSREKTFASATQNSQHSGEGFDPHPIEMDLLELSFKYDHLTPSNARAPMNVVRASVCNIPSSGPGRSKASSQQNVPRNSMPELAPEALGDSDSALARLASKKRAASLPPLTERP
jgi:hypothetical protein